MDACSSNASWDSETEAELRRLGDWADYEDLLGEDDWTSVAIVPAEAVGRAALVARVPGTVAGIAALPILIDQWREGIRVDTKLADGDVLHQDATLAVLSGNARQILKRERPLLNLVSRLSGIATQTQRYVQAVEGTSAQIYDTRKTTPGWRRLEKYAVRCGGGQSHRMGLFDAILIKDNHLALAGSSRPAENLPTAALAVRQARDFLGSRPAGSYVRSAVVEVEVDTLSQLKDALAALPDIVLLDNFSPEQIRQAVRLRNRIAQGVLLEASGGVSLDTVRAIADAGVERIAVGALTHAAPWIDIGLDWR